MRISDWSSDVCSSDLEILELAKEDRGYLLDTEMTAEDWLKVIETYKAKVLEETGKPFPQDPKDQIWAAIGAVFGSWMNQRAITYRRSEERRVGKECVSTCRSRWSPYHYKKKQTQTEHTEQQTTSQLSMTNNHTNRASS